MAEDNLNCLLEILQRYKIIIRKILYFQNIYLVSALSYAYYFIPIIILSTILFLQCNIHKIGIKILIFICMSYFYMYILLHTQKYHYSIMVFCNVKFILCNYELYITTIIDLRDIP